MGQLVGRYALDEAPARDGSGRLLVRGGATHVDPDPDP
jgi:hypothetical protein